MSAPAGRRLAEVAQIRASGAFRALTLIDREGPEPRPGELYALAPDRDGRGPAPRLAFAAGTLPAAGGGKRLDFLLDPVEAGSERLAAVGAGECVWITGPQGDPFRPLTEVSATAFGAVLVGSGIGVAPLALLRARLGARAVPHRVLLGFGDRAHTGGLDLFCGSSGALCPEVRVATADGHLGVQGRVTDLLEAILAGDDARSGVVYGCGPPAMLATVRALCAARSVATELRGETGVHTPL